MPRDTDSSGGGGGGGGRLGRYILEAHRPIPCEDLFKWAHWFETADRHVAFTPVHNVNVSTVFLGLDHGFSRTGPPVLFETMIFGGGSDSYQSRCCTWDEAEIQHRAAMLIARKSSRKPSAEAMHRQQRAEFKKLRESNGQEKG